MNSPLDIKEFEKKLINLPTFTISDEYASNCLLPNAISTTSIYNTCNNLSISNSPTEQNIAASSKTTDNSLNKSCLNLSGLSTSRAKRASLTTTTTTTLVSSEILKTNETLSHSCLNISKVEREEKKECDNDTSQLVTMTTTTTTTLATTIGSIPFIVTKPSINVLTPKSTNLLAEPGHIKKIKFSKSDYQFHNGAYLPNSGEENQFISSSENTQPKTNLYQKKYRSNSGFTGVRLSNNYTLLENYSNKNHYANSRRRKSENPARLDSLKSELLRKIINRRNSLSLNCLNDTTIKDDDDDDYDNENEFERLKNKKSGRSLSAIPYLNTDLNGDSRTSSKRWLKRISSKATLAIKKSIENIFYVNPSGLAPRRESRGASLTPDKVQTSIRIDVCDSDDNKMSKSSCNLTSSDQLECGKPFKKSI